MATARGSGSSVGEVRVGRRRGREGMAGALARLGLAALCLGLLLPEPARAADAAAPDPKTSADAPAGKPAPKKKKSKKSTKPAAAQPAAAAAAEKPAPVVQEVAPAPRPVAVVAPVQEAPPAHRAVAAYPADPAAALVGRIEVEGLLGIAIPFDSGVNTGLTLHGGALVGFRQLSPGLQLQLGGELGITYHGLPSPLDGSFTYFDLLPKARLRFSLDPKVSLYGDGGLGLALAHASVNVPTVPGFPSASSSDTTLGLLLKLGAGAGYQLSPQLSLVGELGLYVYVKDGSATDLRLLVGALYRPS